MSKKESAAFVKDVKREVLTQRLISFLLFRPLDGRRS